MKISFAVHPSKVFPGIFFEQSDRDIEIRIGNSALKDQFFFIVKEDAFFKEAVRFQNF